MQNPEIQPALDAIGFVKDNTTAVKDPLSNISAELTLKIFPNPSAEIFLIDIYLFKNDVLTLDVFDVNGRLVKNLFTKKAFLQGEQRISIEKTDLKSGFYRLILRGGNFEKNGKIIIY